MTVERPVTFPLAVGALLSALVLFVYAQTGTFPFVILDDEVLLVRNPAVAGGLTWESARWAVTTGMDAGYIPVTWLSRLLDVSLFGMDAGKHHLVNVAFHLANVLLLFHLFRRMTGELWKSALVAALFAVHPLHVESVAWVTERKDVLFAFFWLLSMLAYVRYAERPGWARYFAALLPFALSLMSKPMAVTLPFVLLLLDFWPLRRLRSRPPDPAIPEGEEGEGVGVGSPSIPPVPAGRLVLEKVPFLALSAAASVATLLLQAEGGGVNPGDDLPLSDRAETALLSYALYLRKAVWPSDLSVFYSWPSGGVPPHAAVAAAVLLCAITALAVRGIRRRPWLLAGWLWFLGTMLPVIGLVRVGMQSMADRYAYMPLVGIYAAVAWGAEEPFIHRRLGRSGVAVLAAALLALAVTARGQARLWRGTEPLYSHAIAATGGNWFLHNGLGQFLKGAGRTGEAAYHLEEALRYRPGYPETAYDLGQVLLEQGKEEEAEGSFREALAGRPDFAEAHNNLGVILSRTGRFDEAAFHFRDALRVRPDYAGARYNLGVALVRSGLPGEAVEQFRAVLRRQPAHDGARQCLERALKEAGKGSVAGRRGR